MKVLEEVKLVVQALYLDSALAADDVPGDLSTQPGIDPGLHNSSW
jgi:hypothetical protein